ncbi:hypothetical protein CPB85DRAFT_1258765 [Mucidula mucida]|nr:hypothetical protein CPB85DRAFT_1258765 [Mucidula mucida]
MEPRMRLKPFDLPSAARCQRTILRVKAYIWQYSQHRGSSIRHTPQRTAAELLRGEGRSAGNVVGDASAPFQLYVQGTIDQKLPTVKAHADGALLEMVKKVNQQVAYLKDALWDYLPVNVYFLPPERIASVSTIAKLVAQIRPAIHIAYLYLYFGRTYQSSAITVYGYRPAASIRSLSRYGVEALRSPNTLVRQLAGRLSASMDSCTCCSLDVSRSTPSRNNEIDCLTIALQAPSLEGWQCMTQQIKKQLLSPDICVFVAGLHGGHSTLVKISVGILMWRPFGVGPVVVRAGRYYCITIRREGRSLKFPAVELPGPVGCSIWITDFVSSTFSTRVSNSSWLQDTDVSRLSPMDNRGIMGKTSFTRRLIDIV